MKFPFLWHRGDIQWEEFGLVLFLVWYNSEHTVAKTNSVDPYRLSRPAAISFARTCSFSSLCLEQSSWGTCSWFSNLGLTHTLWWQTELHSWTVFENFFVSFWHRNSCKLFEIYAEGETYTAKCTTIIYNQEHTWRLEKKINFCHMQFLIKTIINLIWSLPNIILTIRMKIKESFTASWNIIFITK